MTTPTAILARLCFRTTVMLYAVVVLAAWRSLPVRVPTQYAPSGLPEVWTSRSDLVSLLAGAGLLLGLGFSATAALSRRSRVRQDLLVLGAFAMLVLTALAVTVVAAVRATRPEVGPWGAVVLVLLAGAGAALVVRAIGSRARSLW